MHNLTSYLQFHARTRPDAEALIYDDSRITWAALNERVQAVAGGLKAQGVGPDSIVALVMKNSAAFIELVYAVSHLGAVILPMNFRLSAQEVSYIVGHAGADLVLADDEFRGSMAQVGVPVIYLDTAAQSRCQTAFAQSAPQVEASRRTGADLMRLMYTSGTTDHPKGVMHSYDNFYYKNMDMVQSLQLGAQDRLGIVGPLYHVGGCDLPGLAVHIAGGALVVQRDFDARATVDMIAAESITGIWLAPVMTSGILGLKAAELPDVSSLKWCIGGGERTPESRIRDFGKTFTSARYIDAYGMTETVSGDTMMEPGREIEKIGSVGRPVSMVELEIRDDTGGGVAAKTVGEICMRGPKVTNGYWKDPERTATAMFKDGFLRSGDMGYLDDDGFLFLTDRKKDMIISGGENIASSELERVIFTMPQVQDVAVIGKPDERWGEVPVAVIVLRPKATLDLDQLVEFCRAQLAGFKCPKDILIVDDLPRNPSGKVLKRVLRDIVV